MLNVYTLFSIIIYANLLLDDEGDYTVELSWMEDIWERILPQNWKSYVQGTFFVIRHAVNVLQSVCDTICVRQNRLQNVMIICS